MLTLMPMLPRQPAINKKKKCECEGASPNWGVCFLVCVETNGMSEDVCCFSIPLPKSHEVERS
jgi:hypothetical protein